MQCVTSCVSEQLERQLREEGKRPYVIPVGGSNALGTWGYLNFVEELSRQGGEFTDIVMACGSGGTTAGNSRWAATWPA